ncbi:helix-turn-helix domain-containing protein [Microbacterium sp.]|uniref:helix-turn-helix domain-containing protein n=1 Tax=Microbacterium sp. TaxID=51671 RepID=UPI0025DD539A|nr:helix-turn-helix domain-containing protein [Microbacterium sp.]
MPEHPGAPSRGGPTLTARQPRAIQTALTVLEAVAEIGVGATAREISAVLGLPRATTYRLLNLLVQDEYLVRTPDLSGFALGAKVVHLAAAAAPVRMPSAARDVLASVRAEVRGGVHVVLFAEGRITVADPDPDFPLSDALRLVREPERFALGRLLLAEQGVTGGFAAAAASDLATWGVTRQVGELIPGYGCLAVPMRDGAGSLAGAVGFCGPRHRIEEPGGVISILGPAAVRLTPLLT